MYHRTQVSNKLQEKKMHGLRLLHSASSRQRKIIQSVKNILKGWRWCSWEKGEERRREERKKQWSVTAGYPCNNLLESLASKSKWQKRKKERKRSWKELSSRGWKKNVTLGWKKMATPISRPTVACRHQGTEKVDVLIWKHVLSWQIKIPSWSTFTRHFSYLHECLFFKFYCLLRILNL